MKSCPTYILTLRPLASDVPPPIRLRRLLKIALRSCQLRCTDIRESAGSDKPADKETGREMTTPRMAWEL